MEHSLTRAELLRRAALGSGVLLAGTALPDAAAGAADAGPGPKRGGAFRLGVSGGSSRDFIDGQSIVTRPDADGALRRVALDRDRHWEHGYASTIHAAQGRTAERVLLNVDGRAGHMIGHESWYVRMSDGDR